MKKLPRWASFMAMDQLRRQGCRDLHTKRNFFALHNMYTFGKLLLVEDRRRRKAKP